MAERGAPEGNKNSVKGKLFHGELRKILVQDDQRKLRKIAENLVKAAEESEAWAIKEIMDRMDGKAIQSTDITTDGQSVTSIQVMFVKPDE
jgi:hypothetical protein